MKVDSVSLIETFVPQMQSVELPPIACASEVVGSKFENDGASVSSGGTSLIIRPLSSIKIRLLARGVFRLSEVTSPLRELLTADPGPWDREERTKRPLLSLGMLVWGSLANVLPGLELASYLIGDESVIVS